MPSKSLAASSSDQSAVHRGCVCTPPDQGTEIVAVRLGGQLDAAAAPQLRRALRRARRAARGLALDLLARSRSDVPGARLILDEANRARSENRRLILVPAPLPVDVVLSAIGGSQRLGIVELASVQPALQALLPLARRDQAA